MKLKRIMGSMVLVGTMLLATDLAKIENKMDGALDYSKHPLQLSLKALDKSKIHIGNVSKDGTIQIDLPKIDIRAIHKSAGAEPVSVEEIFRMETCKGRDGDTASKYTDVYPHMYNSISVELYGIQVGLLIPVSSKKVLGNNLYRESSDDYRYHNTPLSLGSEYYFYNFDKDISFKEKCVSKKNNKWTDVSDIEVKKGWGFIKESLLSIDKNSEGEQKHLGVSYENAEIGDSDIQWYLQKVSGEILTGESLELAKKLHFATPLNGSQFTDWASVTLGDFKLTSKEYGALPPEEASSKNKNNLHLVYTNKEKKIDMYILDTAKVAQDLLDAKMIYDMDASFNKEKKKTPYVSQKSDKETNFIYIHKDRVVVYATGYNMEADEMWQQIKKMNLTKLLP